jgi:glycosyltransferase involved in cell wall biosynthesis
VHDSNASGFPRLMFLTSGDAGLAHYVVHLWEPIARYADPLFVTYRSPPPDDLVQERIGEIHPLLDPADPASIEAVVALAREAGVGYVDLHSGTRTKLYAPYFVRLLRRLRAEGIATVLHLHDASVHRAGPDDGSAVAALGHAAQAILVGSEREAETVCRLLPEGLAAPALMRHGPYSLLNRGRFDRRRARARLGLDANAPVVLAFGAFREEKRLEDLITAFERVRLHLPRALLLIQGNARYGAHRTWLEPLAARPGIRLNMDYVPLVRVEALFKAADVVALPYAKTAASGVLNLARAFARPVVVSDRFEVAPEIAGVCGHCVPAHAPGALADALISLLALPESQRRRLAEGWPRILLEETWEHAAQALWDACRRIASGP